MPHLYDFKSILKFQLTHEVVNGIIQYDNVEKKTFLPTELASLFVRLTNICFFQSISTMKVQKIDATLLKRILSASWKLC
jgi:hypothetical protein